MTFDKIMSGIQGRSPVILKRFDEQWEQLLTEWRAGEKYFGTPVLPQISITLKFQEAFTKEETRMLIEYFIMKALNRFKEAAYFKAKPLSIVDMDAVIMSVVSGTINLPETIYQTFTKNVSYSLCAQVQTLGDRVSRIFFAGYEESINYDSFSSLKGKGIFLTVATFPH